MSRLFSIHETAEIEVNEAADFYDLEDPRLGKDRGVRPTVFTPPGDQTPAAG
jgi:hypothetical protein